MKFAWQKTAHAVSCFLDGELLFSDSIDHWQNAVLRLLNFDDATGREWIESVLSAAPDLFGRCNLSQQVKALCVGTSEFYGLGGRDIAWSAEPYSALQIFGEPTDHLWVRGIRNDQSLEVVGNRYLSHGILVRRDTRETVGPPAYNETYFEGNTYGLGYGNYSAQEEWRMQKSRRYLRQIEGIALFLGRTFETNTRLLDVGSGYGFFRQAAAEAGWTHDGQDVSEHAARVGHERFGFETFVGTLDDLLLRAPQAYDVITLFDTIEHLNDPAQSLRVVSQLLAPGGLCALRTPNLCALELDVFGPFYHSLKLEHLHYFSVTSLSHLLLRAGLSPAFVTTESHLLRGLLGTALEVFGREQRGSDLFAVGWKQ